MPLSKKLIAFDLDGTLAESKLPLSSDMAKALVALSHETKVAVVSGGSIEQYKKQFRPAFAHLADSDAHAYDNLILLPTSGTERYAYDAAAKEWILVESEKFPEETKRRVLDVLDSMVASGIYGIPQESYGERIEDRGSQVTLSALGQEAPLEKKKLWDPNQEKRQIMKAAFEKEIPDVSVSIGGTTSLDIVPKGFSKAVSLERLLETLKLEHEDLLYVGDALFPGGNDYSMVEANFDTVQVSGPDETLKYVTDWNENGIEE